MPSFFYRAYTPEGLEERGILAAADEREVARLLGLKGRRPHHITPRMAKGSTIPRRRRDHLRWPRKFSLGTFLADLSVLLDAGFTVDRAVATIIAANSGARQRDLLQGVLDRLSSGETFSQAAALLPGVSRDIAALLESGERTGRIATVVKRLSETMEARAKRRAKLVETLTYPAFLLVVMAIALVVLATVLVPALEPIFEGSAAKKPLTLRALSTLSALLTETPFVVPLALLAVLSPMLAVSRSARATSRLHGLLHKAPLVGSLLRDGQSARYLETLSLLLANGVSMNEALRLAAAATSEDEARLHLAAIGNRVSGGASLHDAMAASGRFDRTTVSLIAIGEDANALPVVLGRAAALQQERVSKRLDAMLKLLTPLLTITLGLLVGGLVVSVMTTILSVNDLALR